MYTMQFDYQQQELDKADYTVWSCAQNGACAVFCAEFDGGCFPLLKLAARDRNKTHCFHNYSEQVERATLLIMKTVMSRL